MSVLEAMKEERRKGGRDEKKEGVRILDSSAPSPGFHRGKKAKVWKPGPQSAGWFLVGNQRK